LVIGIVSSYIAGPAREKRTCLEFFFSLAQVWSLCLILFAARSPVAGRRFPPISYRTKPPAHLWTAPPRLQFRAFALLRANFKIPDQPDGLQQHPRFSPFYALTIATQAVYTLFPIIGRDHKRSPKNTDHHGFRDVSRCFTHSKPESVAWPPPPPPPPIGKRTPPPVASHLYLILKIHLAPRKED